MTKEFAVLIPAYQPTAPLVDFVKQVLESGAALVVVVDDGSGPAYHAIFQSLSQLARTAVLSYPDNHGKGYALKIAMAYVSRRHPYIDGVVTADADGQHLVEDIIGVGEFLVGHSYDYVLGMRDFQTANVPERSYVGNRATSHVFHFLFHRYYSDTQTGLRGIKSTELQALLNVPGQRFEYEMNMLVYMTTHQKKVVHYDIATVYEYEHSSHFRTIKDAARIAKPLVILHSHWVSELVKGWRHDKKDQAYGLLFSVSRLLARMLLPRYSYHLPDRLEDSTATVYVSHHQNMLGPVAIMAWLSEDLVLRVWALDVFSSPQKAYQHYLDYTFTQRFGWPKVLAQAIAWPFSNYVAGLFDSMGAIAVHRQSRQIIQTMKDSVDVLAKGQSVLIFPDVDYQSDQEEIGEIYQGFLHIEKYYNRQEGGHVNFVPLFADAKTKRIIFGPALSFDPDRPFIDQREEMGQRLQGALQDLAHD